MPRVRIDVNEAWLARYNAVVPSAIDALRGFEFQIEQVFLEGTLDAESVLQQLHGQITDLRRNIESLRMIF